MYYDAGFWFDTSSPDQFGMDVPALSIVNQNPGQIYGGAEFPLNNGTLEYSGSSGEPVLHFEANYVQSTGIIDVYELGLISFNVNNLDLRLGTVNVEGLGQLQANGVSASGALTGGQFDEEWGLGPWTNAFTSSVIQTAISALTNGSIPTPEFIYTSTSGSSNQTDFIVYNPIIVAYTNVVSPSNIYTQIIVAGDELGEVTVQPGFVTNSGGGADSIVQWQGVTTGNSGQSITNLLVLDDDIASLTNVALFTNSTSLSGAPLLIPTNYVFSQTSINPLFPGNAPLSASLFSNAFATITRQNRNSETNLYTFLYTEMDPVTAVPDSTVPGSTYSNVPGRVEIFANTCDLTGSTLNAGNFLNFNVTNFLGNSNASITFPRADINVGNPGGHLTISNLVPPTVPFYTGPIECYSAIWSNITSVTNVTTVSNVATTNTFNVTNVFTVLMVNSELEASSPVILENLALNSTNVILSDRLDVEGNFLINAQNLTLTYNGPEALSPAGELYPAALDALWTPYLPSLQNLTNQGLIEVADAAFFETLHSLQQSSPNDAPLQSFVNNVEVYCGGGLTVWANRFENNGSILGQAYMEAEVGPVFVQASNAFFGSSDTLAAQGDMAITAGTLVLSNITMESSGYLKLSGMNSLSDLGVASALSDGDGFSVLALPSGGPATNGLLATTVSNACLPNKMSSNVWVGRPSRISRMAVTPIGCRR